MSSSDYRQDKGKIEKIVKNQKKKIWNLYVLMWEFPYM